METFNPPREPSVEGASVEITPRVLTAPFGDGHLQRTADGLNTQLEPWRLRWQALSHAEADTIAAFFQARGGWEAFLWTPPDYPAALKFICPRWSRDKKGATQDGAGHDAMTASLQEVADL